MIQHNASLRDDLAAQNDRLRQLQQEFGLLQRNTSFLQRFQSLSVKKPVATLQAAVAESEKELSIAPSEPPKWSEERRFWWWLDQNTRRMEQLCFLVRKRLSAVEQSGDQNDVIVREFGGVGAMASGSAALATENGALRERELVLEADPFARRLADARKAPSSVLRNLALAARSELDFCEVARGEVLALLEEDEAPEAEVQEGEVVEGQITGTIDVSGKQKVESHGWAKSYAQEGELAEVPQTGDREIPGAGGATKFKLDVGPKPGEGTDIEEFTGDSDLALAPGAIPTAEFLGNLSQEEIDHWEKAKTAQEKIGWLHSFAEISAAANVKLLAEIGPPPAAPSGRALTRVEQMLAQCCERIRRVRQLNERLDEVSRSVGAASLKVSSISRVTAAYAQRAASCLSDLRSLRQAHARVLLRVHANQSVFDSLFHAAACLCYGEPSAAPAIWVREQVAAAIRAIAPPPPDEASLHQAESSARRDQDPLQVLRSLLQGPRTRRRLKHSGGTSAAGQVGGAASNLEGGVFAELIAQFGSGGEHAQGVEFGFWKLLNGALLLKIARGTPHFDIVAPGVSTALAELREVVLSKLDDWHECCRTGLGAITASKSLLLLREMGDADVQTEMIDVSDEGTDTGDDGRASKKK